MEHRHCYYQFRLPPGLRKYFAIRFGTGDVYIPSVLPMGYREACAVAQCATLCLVLRGTPIQQHDVVPESAVSGSVMPSLLPIMKDGVQLGAILYSWTES